MAKAQTYFIGAKHGISKKSGNPYGLVEVAVVENGKGRAVTLFTEPEVAESVENLSPLTPVLCEFDQRMTANGPRSDLVSIKAA